jgi:hypothetical protein
VRRLVGIVAASLFALSGVVGPGGMGAHAASAAPARAIAPTHGTMLDSLASTVAAELVRGLESGRPVVLLTPIAGDSSSILAQRLLERLRTVSSDVRVRERPLPVPGVQPPTMPPGMNSATDAPPASGPEPLELHARVDAEGVTYVRRIRSFPFGVKGYERLVTMRASVTMQDPRTGRVAGAKSASASLTDVVRKRDLAYVSGGSIGWDPPLPQGTGLRVLEPLLVVGVVAGLVVLFYSNRN